MIANSTARNVLNFVLFQAGWLICVLYPVSTSLLVVAGILVAHFLLISQHRVFEAQFIAAGVVLGGLLDTLWLQTDILHGTEGDLAVVPPWLAGVWAAFMTTLCHSLGWIGRSRWMPWVFPPLAGPFAYWSASRLGAVELPDLWLSLGALALGWWLIFPLLLFLRRTLYPALEEVS